PPASTGSEMLELHGPAELVENRPAGELELTVTLSAAGAACASWTAIGLNGLPAVSACGPAPKESAGSAVQRMSLSKPPLTNCTSAIPPPVKPAPVQRACASGSELAPASQVGYVANAFVEPVMLCH